MLVLFADRVNSPYNFFALGAVLVLSFGLAACSTPRQPTTASHSRGVVAHNVPAVYVVKSGDTVSAIASRYGLDYRLIGSLNGLDSNYTIYPGQRLRLTTQLQGNQRVYRNAPPPRPVNTSPRPNTPTIATSTRVTPNVPPVTLPPTNGQNWQRPVAGNVIRGFDTSSGSLGLWYAASAGTPVRAAQAGTVLYVGSDLPEYGRLVLIQHNNDYISAYAHLGNVLVQEKQTVQAGQTIANVGYAPGVNQSALEFQIRYRGTPINPAQFVR